MNRDPSNARRFIRHPTSIPITCNCKSHNQIRAERMRDISLGGLAFFASAPYHPGDYLQICYPLPGRGKCLSGEVVWCENGRSTVSNLYACGLRFDSGEMLFRARLIEQMCPIEAYRHAQEELGRNLTCEEAAKEWIPNVAHKFPQYMIDPKKD